MCVIVDANVASTFFQDRPATDYLPVIRWITMKNGRLVYGGRLKNEIMKIDRAKRLVLEWERSGRAREIDDTSVAEEEVVVTKLNICVSNDQHVIALARVSGARILCTNDQGLRDDFTNPKLISHPRGKIYSNPDHARLLRHCRPCGGDPPAPGRRRKRD